MNKLWIVLPIFLAACSNSCGGDRLPPAPLPPDEITVDAGAEVDADEDGSYSYYNADYSFILPSSAWRNETEKIGSTRAFFSNAEEKASFLASSEPFADTQDSFALLTVRAVKQSGMLVLHTESNIAINGIKYYAILASKEVSFFRLWVTVKKGKAFTFGCKTENATQQKAETLCTEIANTIKFH